MSGEPLPDFGLSKKSKALQLLGEHKRGRPPSIGVVASRGAATHGAILAANRQKTKKPRAPLPFTAGENVLRGG